MRGKGMDDTNNLRIHDNDVVSGTGPLRNNQPGNILGVGKAETMRGVQQGEETTRAERAKARKAAKRAKKKAKAIERIRVQKAKQAALTKAKAAKKAAREAELAEARRTKQAEKARKAAKIELVREARITKAREIAKVKEARIAERAKRAEEIEKRRQAREGQPRERGGASIPCPVCGGPTRVLATRRSGDRFPGNEGDVWRRRLCKRSKCRAESETVEMLLKDITEA
jgi:hypothetical protein